MAQFVCQPFVSVDDVLTSKCGCAYTEEDSELIADLIDEASDMLYVLSAGAIYGTCTRTKRPVRNCSTTSYGEQRDGRDSIPLPGPNTTIIEVVVDGVVLAPSAYGLIDGRKLFRRDGLGWPTTNDLTKNDTEVGTFSITYSFGRPITRTSKLACIQLVCAMMSSDASISTLKGVVSANLQGVSVQLDEARDTATGMPDVIRFIDLYAHSGPLPSGVWAPDFNQGWDLIEVTTSPDWS